MHRLLALTFLLVTTTLAAEEISFPFAGSITGNRVRVRLAPNLDGEIFTEADGGTLFVVESEENGFFAIRPPEDVRGYIYGKYVEDGVIHGSSVNLRLEPTLEAPILAQLESGDTVEVTDEEDSSWVEVALPDSLRFYVASDYLDHAGEASLVSEQYARREKANHILSSSYLTSQSELDKPFPEISLETLTSGFDTIIDSYSDLSEEVERAEEARMLVQDAYLEKKIAFLEAKAAQSSQAWEERQADLNDVVRSYQEQLAELEQRLFDGDSDLEEGEVEMDIDVAAGGIWHPLEKSQFRRWAQGDRQRTMDEFYVSETEDAASLTGVLQPYNQPVKNKPGDFILVNSLDNLPIAYLYSTKVDLEEQVGREVTILASPRPNNHFAFPAYHVVSVE